MFLVAIVRSSPQLIDNEWNDLVAHHYALGISLLHWVHHGSMMIDSRRAPRRKGLAYKGVIEKGRCRLRLQRSHSRCSPSRSPASEGYPQLSRQSNFGYDTKLGSLRTPINSISTSNQRPVSLAADSVAPTANQLGSKLYDRERRCPGVAFFYQADCGCVVSTLMALQSTVIVGRQMYCTSLFRISRAVGRAS
ncbi:hypothetical protein BDN71DRAFT_1451730 [Pleurotus eryngii]|uniref:Uncharacterized protein n=1 Tax=Pleurotus eryngii TaxID=5323 RepID=A0A9P6DD16_PLEER|nr:hypothetical protein BDN71DRAFT_1451730 [Pleurotus eryngii]